MLAVLIGANPALAQDGVSPVTADADSGAGSEPDDLFSDEDLGDDDLFGDEEDDPEAKAPSVVTTSK